MAYWLSLPLAFFLLSPLMLGRWGGSYVADKFQMSLEEVWDTGQGQDSGGVRSAEGTVGPPRN